MELLNLLNDVISDVVFPSYCLVCGKYLFLKHKLIACDSCWKLYFKEFKGEKCSICGYPIRLRPGTENLCKNCLLSRRKPSFDFIEYYSLYSGLVDIAIKELKFRKLKALAYEIGRDISKSLKEFINKHKLEVVIPVPLHYEELKRRGFNQCEEILKGAKVEFQNVIKKDVNTKKQSSLNHGERRNNVKGIFSIDREIDVKSVCIFDDVLTTGATVEEISLLLKKHGVVTVGVYTVARAIKLGDKAPNKVTSS